MEVKKSKAKTSSELRRELRSLKPYKEELKIGKDVVMSTGTDYGVRASWDKSDIMSDYNAHVFGFREKDVLDSAVRHKTIKEDRKARVSKSKTSKKK